MVRGGDQREWDSVLTVGFMLVVCHALTKKKVGN